MKIINYTAWVKSMYDSNILQQQTHRIALPHYNSICSAAKYFHPKLWELCCVPSAHLVLFVINYFTGVPEKQNEDIKIIEKEKEEGLLGINVLPDRLFPGSVCGKNKLI